MSFFSKVAGTVTNLFQLGGPTGPAIKNNAGPPIAIEHRNSTDTGFVITRGADPNSSIGSGSDNDLVDKHYDDKNFVKSFLLMGG